MDLFTIGYEGSTQPALINRLKEAGIETVVDVRAVAASRRAGFSKTLLREGLADAGIGYLHLRGLGTPKAGREAARKGRIGEMREIFAHQLEEPQAVLEFEALRELAANTRIALLCFEQDHRSCHRAVLAEQLARQAGARIVNL